MILDLRFLIYDLRFTIYDLRLMACDFGFTIFGAEEKKSIDVAFIFKL